MVAVHGPFRSSLVPCMGGLCVYPQVLGSGMVLPRMAGTHGGGTASGLPFFPSLCSASPLHGRLPLGSMSPPSPSPLSVKRGSSCWGGGATCTGLGRLAQGWVGNVATYWGYTPWQEPPPLLSRGRKIRSVHAGSPEPPSPSVHLVLPYLEGPKYCLFPLLYHWGKDQYLDTGQVRKPRPTPKTKQPPWSRM